MNEAFANLIVGAAVAVSVCYSIWRLGPRRMRQSLNLWLSRKFPTRFSRATALEQGGCSGCDGCVPAKPEAEVRIRPRDIKKIPTRSAPNP
ncbi:MAG TPA: hypothetical protein VNQ81_09045 [Povalibacter sp.]|nr:hypothetical protein [Povalibacter sp.]